MTTTIAEPLRQRAQKLGLYGLLCDWEAVASEPWLEPLIEREEAERQRRSLDRSQAVPDSCFVAVDYLADIVMRRTGGIENAAG